MKRQHSGAEMRDVPSKRSNQGQDLDAILDIIDSLIQDCFTITNDDATITRLTAALDHLDSARASVLRARANLFSKKSKSEDAVVDALKAIESDRESSAGYLTAGRIYANQGKQQLALDMYEQGLSVVVPSEWSMLYEEREAAKHRLHQRINFVDMLPAEILENIFFKAVYDCERTYSSCMKVSRHWSNCLTFRCPALWKTIAIDMSYTQPTAKSVKQFLFPHYCDFIQNLEINGIEDIYWETLISAATHNRFSLVRKLTLDYTAPPLQGLTSYISFIAALGNNLTKISIAWLGNCDILSIALSLCPNLEFFQATLDKMDFQPPHPPPPDGYQLRRLDLQAQEDDESLQALIKYCPRLETLSLCDIEPETLNLIDEYCPFLKNFHIGDPEELQEWVTDDPYENQASPGLRTLSYRGFSDQPILEFNNFFSKSQDTLRILELILYDSQRDQPLQQLVFNQLTKVFLRIDESRFSTAESIIRQSPRLEDVTLNFRGDKAPDNFFTCLEVLARLQNLQLMELNVEPTELHQFFDHLAGQHQRCAMRHITMTNSELGVTTDKVLESLADITTLRKISLNGVLEGGASDEGVIAFFRKLHGLPQLEEIRVDMSLQITNDMILEMARIHGLQVLYLSSLESVTSAGVYALANNASSTLRHVSVIYCPGVNERALAYLRQKIPNSA